MRVEHNFDTIAPRRSVVTIGSFDGVHRGHRVLIEHLHAMAARLDAESVVVTFDPHPRIAMGRAEGMQLLTTIEERASLLRDAGIDRMVVAHFDEAFRSQPYELFVRESLVAKLGMVGMIVGYNHRLGQGSEGNYERLRPLAEVCGFDIECVAQHTASGDKISSTVVREQILAGDMRRAELLLGARYMVRGEAVDGAIMDIDPYKLLPPSGEYCCMVNDTEHVATVDDRTIYIPDVRDGHTTLLF